MHSLTVEIFSMSINKSKRDATEWIGYEGREWRLNSGPVSFCYTTWLNKMEKSCLRGLDLVGFSSSLSCPSSLPTTMTNNPFTI